MYKTARKQNRKFYFKYWYKEVKYTIVIDIAVKIIRDELKIKYKKKIFFDILKVVITPWLKNY